ncbi:MAG: GAF domain-containing protein, partial [Acidobacteriaceae bacterium]|nr:GAF domain-containing protein [Acidobacteriaceae bacterium]
MSRTRDLEARLERAEQQLRLFQRVSRLMTRDMALEDVLNEIVRLIRDFLQCESCLIYLVEDDVLVLNASSDESRQNIGKVRLRLTEGLTGWVARERRLLAISREAYNDSRFKF